MISHGAQNSPAEPQAQPPAAEAGKVAPALDPRTPIEVASVGPGTINDPAGSDNKPPGVCDPDLLG
jgi:hypothetical protein